MLFRFRDEVVALGRGALALPAAERHPLYPEVCGAVGEGLTVRGEMDAALALADRAVSGLTQRRCPTHVCPPGRRDGRAVRRPARRRLPRAHRDAPPGSAAPPDLRGRDGAPRTRAVVHVRRRPRPGAGVRRRAATRRVRGCRIPPCWHWRGTTGPRPSPASTPLWPSSPTSARSNSPSPRAAHSSRALRWSVSPHSWGGITIHRVALPVFRTIIARWREMQVWHHQWTTLRNLLQLFLSTENWETGRRPVRSDRGAAPPRPRSSATTPTSWTPPPPHSKSCWACPAGRPRATAASPCPGRRR